MRIFLKKLVFLVIISTFFLALPAAQAAGLVPCNGPDCKVCHIFQLISNITEFLFKQIALPLAGLMFLVGGIMMMIAGGDESRYKKGKEIFINTVIGLVIVLAAFAIVNSLMVAFSSGEFANGWWKVCQ